MKIYQTRAGAVPPFFYGLSFDAGNDLCYILATQHGNAFRPVEAQAEKSIIPFETLR